MGISPDHIAERAHSTMFPGQSSDVENVSNPAYQSSDSSSLTSPKSTQPTDDSMVKMMRGVRFLTALAGIGLVVGMVFQFMTNIITFNITALILCVYLTPIGCVIFIVEWEKLFYDKVVQQLPFLRFHIGRSAFYLFVCGQCLALGGVSGYVLGIAFGVFAVIGIFYHFAKKPAPTGGEHQQLDELSLSNPAPTPTVATSVVHEPFPGEAAPARAEPGSKSLADSDPSFGAVVGGAVGGAALDWASRNPEQAQAAASYAFDAARENPEMARSVAKAAM